MNNKTDTRINNFVKSALAAFMAVLMTASALMPGQEAVYAKTRKVPVKKVTVTKSVTMKVGQSKTIKSKVKPGKAKRFAKLKWKSTKPSIVSVKNGKLTAKKPGKAVIVVKAGKKKAKCKVTVVSPLKGISL